MLATRRSGSIRRKAQDAWLFLSRWAKAPGRMGAVAPSSRALALAMAAEIPADQGDYPIVELGGGTGSITSGLLESGIAPSRLVVIERDRHLAALLRQRFKGIEVICGDAGHLPELLARHGITRVAAIVSGLPLLLFPTDLLDQIVQGCFTVLGSGSPLIQFTYGHASPLAAERFALTARRGPRVWLNIPPATVWVYQRGAKG
jgi:phosphatidylethanolamine/phosphatidyl-N-methylethanolamine N-methyltransferase